jgi:phage terminase large subunit GpA-like protein
MGAADRHHLDAELDGAKLVWQVLADGFRPSPRIHVSDWADKHRRLPSKGAAEPGQWRTKRVPYLREIMNSLSPMDPTKRIVFQKSVQSGGTEAGNNWVGCVMDTQKAPMLVVEPTLELAERWSKQRLTPMIEDTPRLREIVRAPRERDSGNTILLKEFPGGVLIIAGANSGAGLRSMPARYLMLDEVDAYPIEIEEEGDPIKLAEGRTTTFARHKIFLNSTPTTESLSRIHPEFLASDQRYYYVPCPHCDHYQRLVWDNLTWPEGNPKAARYVCEACGALIDEHHKTEMLERGEWRANFPGRDVVGFHISALYTPIGLGKSWDDLADEWEQSATNPVKRKAFINLRLGEVTKDPNEKLDSEELAERAEARAVRVIPKGCLLLTAGVDVQKDRWAVMITGWGRSTTWVIDWFELPGDPKSPADWLLLESRLSEPIINQFHVPMRIERIAVDSGYLQDDVLHFTRARQHRGWFAVKGAKDIGKPIITRATKIDYSWRGRIIKAGAEQWQVGGYVAKEWLFARLTADRERLPEDRSVRFPAGLGEVFYEQLTAEVFDSVRRRFVKIRERNEALDTFCYALAAACHPLLRANTWQEPRWVEREAMLEPAQTDLFATLTQVAAQPATPPASPPASPPAAPAESERSIAAERLRQFQERYREATVYDE